MKRVLLAICFVVFLGTSSFAEESYARLAKSVVVGLAFPSLEALSESIKRLAPAASKFCTSQTEENRRRVDEAFHRVMDAWQVAQIFTIGPLVRKGRFSRIHFWPGRVGSTERYLRKVFRSRPPDLTDAKKIAKRSVAIHSLAAFERFIFDPSTLSVSRQVDPYRCRIATAIAGFQLGMVGDIILEWRGPEGFKQTILEPRPHNPLYRKHRDAANDVLGLFGGSLERIARLKLRRPLGKSLAKIRTNRLENWRSGRSKRNIRINLETLQKIYSREAGLEAQLRAVHANALADEVGERLRRVGHILAELPAPLHKSISEEAIWVKLDHLHGEIEQLVRMTSGPIAQTLGLVVGFNSLDGD
tara:strand:- start:1202 stop:2278 length:1077 start_codon:yes stop_codon:yes gene_type:complete